MNNNIYPCLWFDGKAKEAAEFYCSLFKGATITVDTPMVVMLEIYGRKIMGLNGGPKYSINPSISFFVLCGDIDETNRVWDKLLEGGSVLMPIDKYFWSERYGWLQDKFGMTWQVSVVENPGDAPKLTPSLLFTGNRFGRAAEAINLYSDIFKNSVTDVMFPYPDGDTHAGKVMYSEIKLDGCNFILMDGPGEHTYTFNEGVSFVVDCDGQEETDYYWNRFAADGGQESRCAWLKDKFGVSWQIVPKQLTEYINHPDREKAGRALQAMLKMNKIIIADLKKAFEGG
jgi:predicted 3-demethylubiquinone-9 3-methyltransferase (glyoxalase superfamily)